MQPKFTLKKWWKNCLGLSPLVFVLLFLFTGKVNAQTYINGGLTTGTTTLSGVAAPAGSAWSELGNVAGNTTVANNILANAANPAFTIADNFTVPAGQTWNVTKMYFYFVQAALTPSSPITNVRIQIHNANPSLGPTTIVFGDLTTNRLLSTGPANSFRIGNTIAPPPGSVSSTNFPIWEAVLNVNTSLPAGIYWVEFASGVANQFAVASTIAGTRTQAGVNAIQKTVSSGIWAPIIDGGNPAGNPVPQDIYFKVDYNLGPCSGTPDPGNTISNLATVCTGTSFTLSLQKPVTGSGISYQWQYASSVNGPWTNFGTNSATQNTTLPTSAATYYRSNVTCVTGPATTASTPVLVNLSAATSCYCQAGATSASFEKISKVDFGTISNPSVSTSGYEDFTTQTTTLVKGQTAPITVTLSQGFISDEVRVWIDFNQDGDFTDAGEAVYVSALGTGPHTGNITISPAALTGPARMRIRMQDADPSSSPNNATSCGNSLFGQVEDYTVNIQPCVQSVITSSPTGKSVQCSGTTTFTVAATGSVLIYSWQQRLTPTSPWTNVTNGGVFSGATTSTLTLTNVTTAMSGYEYRALVSNLCTGVDFSASAALTVVPLIATVSPVSASICTGSIQKLMLTNASSPTTVTFTSNTSFGVPDGNEFGVLSPAIIVSGIPAGAVIGDVSIGFNMTHTFVGDLDINVIAPNSGNLNLVGGLDGGNGNNSTDHFTNTVISSASANPISGAAAPRTGTFAAEKRAGYGPTGNTQSVTDWSGLTGTVNGSWRLAIADFFSQDVGTVTSWSVTITYGAPATGVWTSSPAIPNTMFTDAAATVPYITGAQATSIYVKPADNTSYSVVYSNATPCTSAPTVIPVTVVKPPTLVVNPVDKSVCVGSNTSFTTSAAGGPFTYQWEVSTTNGASWVPIAGATSATFTVSNATALMNNNLYRAVISAAPCAGTTTTTAAKLTVNALPVITIATPITQLVPGRTTIITATTNPGPQTPTSFSWTRDGVAVANAITSSIPVNIDKLGTYRATVTDISGCVASSNSIVIGAEASDRLFIYPNPTTGLVQARLYYSYQRFAAEKREVTIYNSSGQLVIKKNYTLFIGLGITPYLQMDFDLSNMAAGIYVIKVTERNTGKIVSGLIVVQ